MSGRLYNLINVIAVPDDAFGVEEARCKLPVLARSTHRDGQGRFTRCLCGPNSSRIFQWLLRSYDVPHCKVEVAIEPLNVNCGAR